MPRSTLSGCTPSLTKPERDRVKPPIGGPREYDTHGGFFKNVLMISYTEKPLDAACFLFPPAECILMNLPLLWNCTVIEIFRFYPQLLSCMVSLHLFIMMYRLCNGNFLNFVRLKR